MAIRKLSQVSTKNGDRGTSSSYSSETFNKDDILFELLGTMDELSSFLGLSYQYLNLPIIKKIQAELQTVNSLIATNPTSPLFSRLPQLTSNMTDTLEKEIQQMLDEHPLEPVFCLPGSDTSLFGAYIDVSRTLARKAERRMVTYIHVKERNDLSLSLQLLNRLSDYLFVLARNVGFKVEE